MATRKSETSKAEDRNDDVQAKVDEADDQGYFGIKVDPTPNENYTVAGVLAEKPTPETHADAAAAAAGATNYPVRVV